MEEKEPLTMQGVINRLKNIDKDELREREFFQEVMSVIKDMKGFELNEEDFEKFSATLKEIGCVDYNTWLSGRRSHNVDVKKQRIDMEIDKGAISGAERMIENLLLNYRSAHESLSMINSNSQGESWVERWLKNSKDPMKRDKSDSEYEFYEEELLSQRKLGDRKKEQAEIPSMEVAKGVLQAEMRDITKQIEDVEVKKMESIGKYAEKRSEIKGLEQKQ